MAFALQYTKRQQSKWSVKTPTIRALGIFAIWILAVLILPIFSRAQTGEATLDRQQIVLGEQAQLRVKLADVPNGYNVVSFFGWDSSVHVEVIERGKMDTVNLNDQYTYIQDWKITSFDSGKWALPISGALLQNQQTGEKKEIKIDSVYIDVLPVDISNMKDYHDIKDILTVKYFDVFWIVVGVVALVVLVLLFFLIRYWVKRRKKKPVKLLKIDGSPLDWALAEIGKLQSQTLSMYQYFGSLNGIVRTYLQERADLPTYKETSDELILRMREHFSTDVVADSFYQNLKMMDAVKFAKYVPSEDFKKKTTDEIVDSLKWFDKKINAPSNK
ncbi:MAG: hypothetical protein QM610_04795 [Chitinophagaceae bacterium]